MKAFIGIDLGSTTTKAVVMDEARTVLGRGITNSRSNYDTAAAIAKQEALVAARFLLRHGRRGVVVRARVGDAAPEDRARLVHHHRLRGGGAQVHADEGLHACAPAAARFCLIIWK